jgi:N-acetyl-gamma-glutamyl-phosphate reductase
MQSVRTAVVGASGYSGQELLRYLARHPVFQLVLVTSRQNAGQPLSQFVHGLPRELGALPFVDAAPDFALAERADLFFLAVPHGTATPFVVALREAGKIVVDLSADFRTTDPAVYKEFYDHDHPAPEYLREAVYGLPEIHRERLRTAKLIAAPGCFPTSIILPLAPFLAPALGLKPDTIVVNSLSGASGAGRKADLRLLFGEISDNMYAYSVPKHRHLSEIEQELALAAGHKVTISFTPHIVPMHRGMYTTTVAQFDPARTSFACTGDDLCHTLEKAYGNEPFVELLPPGQLPESRHVANSNRIQIAARYDERTNRLLLFSSIDNLGKGNASQAIQAANLALGLEETLGLT